MLPFDDADHRATPLRIASGVDFDPVVIQPQRLSGFEVDSVLGAVGGALGGIELEVHRGSIAWKWYENYTYGHQQKRGAGPLHHNVCALWSPSPSKAQGGAY